MMEDAVTDMLDLILKSDPLWAEEEAPSQLLPEDSDHEEEEEEETKSGTPCIIYCAVF